MTNRHTRRAVDRAARAARARREPGTAAAQALAKRVKDAQDDLNRYATMHKIAGDAARLAVEYPEQPLPDDYEPGVDGNPNAIREHAAEVATIMLDTSSELVFEALVELYDAYAAFDEPARTITSVPSIVDLAGKELT